MTGTEIVAVDAWEALDSRGHPTVACRVGLEDGSSGVAMAPSGASTGRHEVFELRDGGTRYEGLGVRIAVANVRSELSSAVLGWQADDQRGIDNRLRETDGRGNLSRLGANAVLSVSIASAIALAKSRGVPLWRVIGSEVVLPLPMVNIVSGGAHAGNVIDIQDVLAIPVGATTFSQAIEWAAKVRAATARIAIGEDLASNLVADEGGIAARLPNNRAAVELVARGVEASGLRLGEDVGLAIDIAATQFVTADGLYNLKSEGRVLESGELVDEVAGWCKDFPVLSVEDILGEDDWDGWKYASEQLSGIQLLGDDLFATQFERLNEGYAKRVANAVLIKVNQNGTLTGALDVIGRARRIGYAPVVSARSGETEDTWLADLAVGSSAGQIKVGSTTRSERTAKWNRLLQIEREASDNAVFSGRSALNAGSGTGR